MLSISSISAKNRKGKEIQNRNRGAINWSGFIGTDGKKSNNGTKHDTWKSNIFSKRMSIIKILNHKKIRRKKSDLIKELLFFFINLNFNF